MIHRFDLGPKNTPIYCNNAKFITRKFLPRRVDDDCWSFTKTWLYLSVYNIECLFINPGTCIQYKSPDFITCYRDLKLQLQKSRECIFQFIIFILILHTCCLSSFIFKLSSSCTRKYRRKTTTFYLTWWWGVAKLLMQCLLFSGTTLLEIVFISYYKKKLFAINEIH